jgi:hypothetical protein
VATYKDADAVLHEAVKIQEHLAAQDGVLSTLLKRLPPQHPVTATPRLSSD